MHIVKYHIFNDIDHYISLRTFQAGRIESDVEFVSNILTAEFSEKSYLATLLKYLGLF